MSCEGDLTVHKYDVPNPFEDYNEDVDITLVVSVGVGKENGQKTNMWDKIRNPTRSRLYPLSPMCKSVG